ncbi:MAG: creatininase family protein [Herpetosiphon sp.]
MHLRLEEMTRGEAQSVAPHALVVLPTGAIEQHGPHLPVGVDTYIVTQIAHAAATDAAKQIPIVVAPALPFGSSHHHLPFGGTLSLTTESYYRVLSDLAESLIIGGFRRIFLLNGHGGNDELIQLVARDLALKHPVALAAASYWTIARAGLLMAHPELAADLPGHSGIFETSVMQAMYPHLVREPRPHRDASADTAAGRTFRVEVHGAWQRIDGYTDSPNRSNAEQGASYLATIVRDVTQAFISFHRQVE